MAIDPGSNCTGVSVIEFDCVSKTIISTHAFTIDAKRLAINSSFDESFGNRLARIDALRQCLIYYFCHYKPAFTICESPFIGISRPQAYGALTETICAVRLALAEYDPFQTLFSIDPPSAKIGVGAPGNAKKDVMMSKVCGLAPVLNFANGEQGLAALDEHSIDAIAIGYSLLNRMFANYFS